MPNPRELLLLQAAVLPPEAALGAWQSWSQQVDLLGDELPIDLFRILPTLYANLEGFLEADPHVARLKGVHRYHWTQTLLNLAASKAAIDTLLRHEIPVLLLKGAAMHAAGYTSAANRSLGDIDFLVPYAQRTTAIDLLLTKGWLPVYDIPMSRYAYMHSIDMHFSSQFRIDMHWFALHENPWPGVDEALWSRAVDVRFGGLPVKRPDDTDLLLHLLASGGRWDVSPGRRWIPDAIILFRQQVSIDWDRLAAEAARRRMARVIGQMLAYLQTTFDVPIPKEPIHALCAAPASASEKLELWARNRQKTHWRGPLFHVHNYWRLTLGTQEASQGHRPVAGGRRIRFDQYLRDWWGVRRSRDLPGYMIQRAGGSKGSHPEQQAEQ